MDVKRHIRFWRGERQKEGGNRGWGRDGGGGREGGRKG